MARFIRELRRSTVEETIIKVVRLSDLEANDIIVSCVDASPDLAAPPATPGTRPSTTTGPSAAAETSAAPA